MQRTSREQLEAQYLKRWAKAKVLRLPSWWLRLAPGCGPRFWTTVESMRKEAGVSRSDTSAVTYIINQLRSRHERTR